MKTMPFQIAFFLLSVLFYASLPTAFATEKQSVQNEILIDSVVAAVNEKPITLHEVGQRMRPPQQLTEESLSQDPTARQILEELILERLIEEEAGLRNIRVTSRDVQNYVEEVARLNNLSTSEFEEALKKEKQDISAYEQMVKGEILRTRLISELQQLGASVSDEEVEERLSRHPALARPGTKVGLRQITLSGNQWKEEDAREKLSHIKELVTEGNHEFAKLALQYSESPEASNGGFLGIIAEEELSPMIFNAVFALENGEISDIINSPIGFHLFQLERRFIDSEEERQKLGDDIRQAIQNERIEQNLQTFFTEKLYDLHVVERKAI